MKMAPGEIALGAGEPYTWDESVEVPIPVQQIWREVGLGIDKSQTVVWKNAVESLDASNRFLASSELARRFVERYMQKVIGILVEQQPLKIGQHERSCVEESLEFATVIIANDIKIQQKRKGECTLLPVLALIFNRKKAYYKGSKGNWNVNHLNGLPEIRVAMIQRFHAEGGFSTLADYLSVRINTPLFPSLEFLHQILSALFDAVPSRQIVNDDKSSAKEMEDHAIMVSQAVMDYMNSFTDESLKKQPPELIITCREYLQKIFDRLVVSRRKQTYKFYSFWRGLILKLITSRSLPLRLTGWEQLKDCIEACKNHRPPPKMFEVSQAGLQFVNGKFEFAGVITADGYAQRGEEISYKRRIPPSEKDGPGKDLTLFRCTMRSQQKWWFLSEADEEQPGTDRDIDYYQHKSKEDEELQPPPRGWVTCRNAGIDPPPQLRGQGLMVPKGEEYNTLEHLLARWAIENNIVELVLGASLHREVVNRSTPLIEFLASMCEHDEPVKGVPDDGVGPNAFCLKAEHLLLAWRTCASKADAAVSEEIYHLLVSILPSLPNLHAISLVRAVEDTLNAAKGSSLFEVAEFCGALATLANMDAKAGQLGVHYFRSEVVRVEVLTLLWAVLTHPNASALKNYEILKQYVTNELRIDPLGRSHREKFLESCTKSLALNAGQLAGGTPVDEFLALRMVQLTIFVLEACPPEQAMATVNANQGRLASLLFNELTAYLSRHKADVKSSPIPKRSSVGSVDIKLDNAAALYERLRILRYVYGVSETVKLSIVQLQHLWQLCDIPADREEVMVFVAHASTFGDFTELEAAIAPRPQGQNDSSLSSAFSDEVRTSAFLDLFCSQAVSWDELGEGAYKSFYLMFKKLRQSPAASLTASGPALDALWRICLTAGNENVAAQSMKDLLAVYATMASGNKSHNAWSCGPPSAASEQMQIDEMDENFGDRVFGCLAEVKKGLDAGDPSSERSAERCLRILNAAVGQDGSSGRSITRSTVSLLSSLPNNCTLFDAVQLLPHGMRGQSSYRRIGVMVKRTIAHNIQGPQQLTESDTQGGSRQQSTVRFSLDVHPLETLSSVKAKVAHQCQCSITSVKPFSASGRLALAGKGGADSSQLSLNVVPDDSTVDQLGISHGCEMVFVIADRQNQGATSPALNKNPTRKNSVLDLGGIFGDPNNEFAAKIFQTLLSVLEALPWRTDTSSSRNSSYTLVWDLLLAMPTNAGVSSIVRSSAGVSDDSMLVDSTNMWASLIDHGNFQKSVYIMQAIESFLQPAPEVLSILPSSKIGEFEKAMKVDSTAFRRGFIDSGGFTSVIEFFSGAGATISADQTRCRMANAAALRILICCLFGNTRSTSLPLEKTSDFDLDEVGVKLLESLSSAEGLLRNLTAMVVFDEGISTSTISDVLKFLRLLFRSTKTSETFIGLPNRMAEKFVITLVLWEGGPESARSSSAMSTSSKIRMNTHDLVLSIPLLAKHALPWLINALESVDVASDATSEYFDVLKKLVSDDETNRSAIKASDNELKALGIAVSKKISSCPRPTNGSAIIDVPTGVLCGCLRLLRALIEWGGGAALISGTSLLMKDLGIAKWSELATASSNDSVLIDLMGAIFDGFLSPGGSSSAVAICCDKESRQLGFEAVAAAARSCSGTDGYIVLVNRIDGIVSNAAPYLRHRWGQFGNAEEGQSRSSLRNPSKYSGLRNQGCTCYMNSFLQQLFMMPSLRKAMCAAPIPSILRKSGGGMASNGVELVGKKISLQWETGVPYDADVEGFDASTGMHTIRYCPIFTTKGSSNQSLLDDITRMPAELPEEFFLTEGRPGKETGVFDVITKNTTESSFGEKGDNGKDDLFKENEDESAARNLFEEVQRTFIHLDEGSRGRCFDPRALVEACACLKLEFDVWQQNDASEFAMKLLDRMEIALKKWAPAHFQHLEHTFRLKQTKQKICKKCSLTTNREENLMSIDCQIRGKTDIHEALATMCEVEYMEGNNKVFCDRCKENTDTVLKTAISALPDMLILSLKRFDLDYNTFETVKLNSRLAFGQTLNMKRYTLEGIEAVEKANFGNDSSSDPSPMDTSDDGASTSNVDPLGTLSDDDYEYELAGVLVHAGVAQGGHYYSFIKDRSSKSDAEQKWYRFDDEDVTPWDPASLEIECFGGKVKKENKWPNGQVQIVESEQFANALMVFYEKVKPAEHKDDGESTKCDVKNVMTVTETTIAIMSGFEAFEPDVRRSNATHRWQTFLFDSEFQAFLKGLLGLCRLTRNQQDRIDIKTSPVINGSSTMVWKIGIVDMLSTFFFDVFLYSFDKTWLQHWVCMHTEIFYSDPNVAQMFVRKLASRTRCISGNWLRTYLSDCPEMDVRGAAVQIFGSALQSCVNLDIEKLALKRWIKAYVDFLVGFDQFGSAPMPTRLRGKWKVVENPSLFAKGEASSIGVVISFLTALIEAAPRTWKYNADLCALIRDISNAKSDEGGSLIVEAMRQAEIPARLTCLVSRDKSPISWRVAFPGASVALEVVESQMRQDTNPDARLLPLGGNQMITSVEKSPMPSDYLSLFEALCRLVGMKGLVLAPLLVETEQPRGRPTLTLTAAATSALTTIYRESCTAGMPGMGQREVDYYLQRCGVDSTSVPRQKIIDIMAKYPCTDLTGKGGPFLSLEGFLAYYCEISQTQEASVRSDFHSLGFRPNLSRRSNDAIRVCAPDGREQLRHTTESVCIDVKSLMALQGKENFDSVGLGMFVFELHAKAYAACEPLAEYLLAATVFERDSNALIKSTLTSLRLAPTGWTGNEVCAAAVMVLKVLAAMPDAFHRSRISEIMQCSEGCGLQDDQGVGLLLAAKAVGGLRSIQIYSTELYVYERYIDVLKELRKLHPVHSWMKDNRELWVWMERDLIRSDENSSQRQARGDYSVRREGDGRTAQILDNPRSDSDMVGVDSEDDEDDDSRLYDDVQKFGPEMLIVQGAGLDVINGTYRRQGSFENAGVFTKRGSWNGSDRSFSLFRCNVSNNTKHWYISIVPHGVKPGTNTDTDFYSAPMDEKNPDTPPARGWIKATEGQSPPPGVSVVRDIEPDVEMVPRRRPIDQDRGPRSYI